MGQLDKGELARCRMTMSGSLLVSALGAVVIANLRAWRRDRALASSLAKRTPSQVQLRATPRVSVLVAAWNEGQRISRLLDSFVSLDYPNKEMILAIGGDSVSDAPPLPLSYLARGDIHVIEHPGNGKQSALRRCWQYATGDIIFLTDADCILDSASFRHLIAPLIDGCEEVATGVSSPVASQRRDPFVLHQWAVQTYDSAHFGQYVAGLLGRNCAITRRALEDADAFNDDVLAGTDYHLAKRLLARGYRIRFVPDSEVQTTYQASVRGYWRQQSRWLRNVALHGLRFRSYREALMSLRTSLLGLALLALPIALPFARRPAAYLWLVAVLHGYLSRLRYIAFASSAGRFPSRWHHYPLAACYMLIDFVAWAMPLLDYIVPSRRYRW